MTTHEPSEREIDAIISMRPLSDARYASVQRALGAVKSALVIDPDATHVEAFAARLAVVAGSSVPPAAAGRASRASSRPAWHRRVAAALGVAAVSVIGVAGAAAANGAAPGDALYGLDRAFERVGIHDGGTAERLGEAQMLAQRGDVDGAIDLAVKALDDDGQHDAARALHDADAQDLLGSHADEVADFLTWLAQQERVPGFGADVAARAKELGRGPQPTPVLKPEDPGAQGSKPEDPGAQGSKPEDPGAQGSKPEDPGAQGSKPEDPGAQGNKPEDPGSQGNKPEDPGSQGNKPESPGSQGKKESGKP